MKASKVDRACKVDVIVSSGRSVAELINIEIQARVWQITTSFFIRHFEWGAFKTKPLLNYLGFPDTCLTNSEGILLSST